jgi:hypothetical protein
MTAAAPRSPFRDGAIDRHHSAVTDRATPSRLDPPRWLALLWVAAVALAALACWVVV